MSQHLNVAVFMEFSILRFSGIHPLKCPGLYDVRKWLIEKGAHQSKFRKVRGQSTSSVDKLCMSL